MMLYGRAVLVIVVVVLIRLILKKFMSGPSQEQIDAFKVHPDGGALKRLNKDEDDRIKVTLAKKTKMTHDSYIFRYSVGDSEMTLGTGVCGHIRLHATTPDGEELRRKYTPITDVRNPGFFDCLIKIYPENKKEFPDGGKMSRHLEAQKPGDVQLISGPFDKLTYLGFGQFLRAKKLITKKQVGCLAGGTGITPCYSAINHGLQYEDKTNFYLIFGNKTNKDVLLEEELKQLKENNPDKFHMHLLFDKEPSITAANNLYTTGTGYITKLDIQKHMPPPGEDTLIMFSGPPPFEELVTKLLKGLGYTAEMMFKH